MMMGPLIVKSVIILAKIAKMVKFLIILNLNRFLLIYSYLNNLKI